MTSNPATKPLIIKLSTVRRFMLSHFGLYPPRQRSGKTGVMSYIRHIGALQYDPVNVVGTNPDVVLQSRIQGYQSTWLDELLHQERELINGWDKMAAIFPTKDWPYFARHRANRRAWQTEPGHNPGLEMFDEIIEIVRARGPISSIDLKENDKVDWSWGQPTRLVRAAMQGLYSMGELGIHNRVGTRRYFDLIARLIEPEILNAPDPNPSDEVYQEWHLLRRIGGLGLASSRAGVHWSGILGIQSKERKLILKRLVEKGQLLSVSIEEIPRREFYIRTVDLPTLKRVQGMNDPDSGVAFIAPLDNLIWDRELVARVFNFDYKWEIYTPAKDRKYGYYVLPVLYGDRFIARFEPAYDRKKRTLNIKGWWWEADFTPGGATLPALVEALCAFSAYLGATNIRVNSNLDVDKFFLEMVDQVTLGGKAD